MKIGFCILRIVLVLVAGLVLGGCGKGGSNSRFVVVYTSQDGVFAEPILKEFEEESGIEVRTVFDSEAVKTVGLVNRLLTERDNPQCDIFWNNEEFRTRQLAARGIFRETNAWTHLGYRTRRIVVNTNILSMAKAPRTFSDATNEIWRGKVALAYPLFGTTATHFHAWRQFWGPAVWENWCRALAANKPFLVDGNSVVVKMVSRGRRGGGSQIRMTLRGRSGGVSCGGAADDEGDVVYSEYGGGGSELSASGGGGVVVWVYFRLENIAKAGGVACTRGGDAAGGDGCDGVEGGLGGVAKKS